MPSKRDNDEERLSRIAALMEEYRVNHEDLVEYINTIRSRAREAREVSRKTVTASQDRSKRTRGDK
jgi:hypothetical protein